MERKQKQWSLSSYAVHVKLTACFLQESFLIAEKHEASRFSVSFCLVLFESSGFGAHFLCVAGQSSAMFRSVSIR